MSCTWVEFQKANAMVTATTPGGDTRYVCPALRPQTSAVRSLPQQRPGRILSGRQPRVSRIQIFAVGCLACVAQAAGPQIQRIDE